VFVEFGKEYVFCVQKGSASVHGTVGPPPPPPARTLVNVVVSNKRSKISFFIVSEE